MKTVTATLTFAIFLILAVTPAVHGGMVFDKRLIEINAGPEDEVVTAEFKFRIEGEDPVKIKEYEAACNCLSAEISEGGKLEWKPRESGTIKGRFEIRTFTGTVDKYIMLRIEGQPYPEKLTVRVTIPILFEVQPQSLFWDLNGEAKPQSFKIAVKHDKPIRITEISGTNEQFQHELKTIRDGWEYELVVTPTTVATRAFGLLRIRNDCEFKRHQSAQAFVVVRRGAAGPLPAPKGG